MTNAGLWTYNTVEHTAGKANREAMPGGNRATEQRIALPGIAANQRGWEG